MTAQSGPRIRVQGAWGTTLLISPGSGLTSAPGRMGNIGIGLILGGDDRRLDLRTSLSIGTSMYRTRMAYRVNFVSLRAAYDLDIMLGASQMNGTTLLAGGFIGTVTQARTYVEQRGKELQFPHPTYTQRDALASRNVRAGLLLGLQIPLGRNGRLGIDLQLRQHLVPLVDEDQYFALVFQPEQRVLTTTTRATELCAGLGYLLR